VKTPQRGRTTDPCDARVSHRRPSAVPASRIRPWPTDPTERRVRSARPASAHRPLSIARPRCCRAGSSDRRAGTEKKQSTSRDFLCARLRESFTGLVQDDQRRLDHPQEHVALDDAGRANFADASGRPPNSPPAVSTAPNRVSAIATLPPAPSAPCCLPPSPPSPRLPRRPPCHRRLRSPLPHPRRAQSDGTWYCQRSGSEPMHDCEAAARADCRMPRAMCVDRP